MRILIKHKKVTQNRYVLFPPSFHDDLAKYINIQKEKGAVYLFESNRKSKFSTRSIRVIVKKYAKKAGITKRIHPHLFRHQILTYLTNKGSSLRLTFVKTYGDVKYKIDEKGL